MVEPIYLANLVPLLMLIVTLKGDNRRLILFFAWGLTAAIASYYALLLVERSELFTSQEVVTHAAPVVEELLKLLPLLLLLRQHSATRYSLVRLALAVGVGFSIVENSFYLAFVINDTEVVPVAFVLLRSVTASILHGGTTALVGWAIQVMVNERVRSPLLPAGALLLAIFIHGLFNQLGQIDELRLVAIAIPIALFAAEFAVLNLFGSTRMRLGAGP